MHLPRTVFLALAAFTAAAADDVPREMALEALPRLAPAPEDNPGSAAKVALGRLLFFDPVLSATQTVACATCHHPGFGWGDGRAVPIGVGGEGVGPGRKLASASAMARLTRNAPSLLNVAFNGLVSGVKYTPSHAPMFWDSRVEGLEAQALVPLGSREEMRGDACASIDAVPQAVKRVKKITEYGSLFQKAFPEAKGTITSRELTQALAAFERSLIAPDTPFDRFMRGDASALSDLQKRGMEVFREAGCQHCHGGPMFSDFKLHVIAVPDSTGNGRREFRTPTLRHLKFTAPYMHNGGMKTLDDVLAFYEQLGDAASESLDGADQSLQPPLDPLFRKLNLKAEDFPSLTAFLESLSDGRHENSVPANVPSGLPVAGSTPSLWNGNFTPPG